MTELKQHVLSAAAVNCVMYTDDKCMIELTQEMQQQNSRGGQVARTVVLSLCVQDPQTSQSPTK